jgi:hypothetical protein
MPGINDLICILCGTLFDQRSYGMMNCWCHPKEYDSNLGYYPCCGLTELRSDTKFNTSVGQRGCTKIDHVHSREDYESVLKEPFFLIPFDEIDHVEVLKNPRRFGISNLSDHIKVVEQAGLDKINANYLFKNQRVIPIADEIQLVEKYPLDTFDGVFQLDINQLHEGVKNEEYGVTIVFHEKKEIEDDVEDDSLSNWFEYSHRDNIKLTTTDFIPFYIVRRMENDVSISKLSFMKEQGNLQRYQNLKRQRLK